MLALVSAHFSDDALSVLHVRYSVAAEMEPPVV